MERADDRRQALLRRALTPGSEQSIFATLRDAPPDLRAPLAAALIALARALAGRGDLAFALTIARAVERAENRRPAAAPGAWPPGGPRPPGASLLATALRPGTRAAPARPTLDALLPRQRLDLTALPARAGRVGALAGQVALPGEQRGLDEAQLRELSPLMPVPINELVFNGRAIVVAERPQAARARRPRPQPPLTFEQVWQPRMLEQLAATVRAHRRVAIHGIPGVGKRTLALQAAAELYRAGSFPGGVLLVEAVGDLLRQPARVDELLAEWYSSSPDERRDAITPGMVRAALGDEPLLAIFTGVRQGDAERLDVLTRALPSSAHLVLVCESETAARELGAELVPVQVPSLEEARAIALAALGLDGDATAPVDWLDDLITTVDCHPQALKFVVESLAERGREEWPELARATARRFRSGSGAVPALELSGVNRTVARVLMERYNTLDPDLQRRFLACGLLAPGVTFTPADAARVWGCPLEQAAADLNRLTGRSLLMRAEPGRSAYRLNGLLRNLAFGMLRHSDEVDLGATLAQLCAALAAEIDAIPAANPGALLPMLPQVAHAVELTHAVDPATRDPARAAAVISACGSHMLALGLGEQIVVWCRRSLEALPDDADARRLDLELTYLGALLETAGLRVDGREARLRDATAICDGLVARAEAAGDDARRVLTRARRVQTFCLLTQFAPATEQQLLDALGEIDSLLAGAPDDQARGLLLLSRAQVTALLLNFGEITPERMGEALDATNAVLQDGGQPSLSRTAMLAIQTDILLRQGILAREDEERYLADAELRVERIIAETDPVQGPVLVAFAWLTRALIAMRRLARDGISPEQLDVAEDACARAATLPLEAGPLVYTLSRVLRAIARIARAEQGAPVSADALRAILDDLDAADREITPRSDRDGFALVAWLRLQALGQSRLDDPGLLRDAERRADNTLAVLERDLPAQGYRELLVARLRLLERSAAPHAILRYCDEMLFHLRDQVRVHLTLDCQYDVLIARLRAYITLAHSEGEDRFQRVREAWAVAKEAAALAQEGDLTAQISLLVGLATSPMILLEEDSQQVAAYCEAMLVPTVQLVRLCREHGITDLMSHLEPVVRLLTLVYGADLGEVWRRNGGVGEPPEAAGQPDGDELLTAALGIAVAIFGLAYARADDTVEVGLWQEAVRCGERLLAMPIERIDALSEGELAADSLTDEVATAYLYLAYAHCVGGRVAEMRAAVARAAELRPTAAAAVDHAFVRVAEAFMLFELAEAAGAEPAAVRYGDEGLAAAAAALTVFGDRDPARRAKMLCSLAELPLKVAVAPPEAARRWAGVMRELLGEARALAENLGDAERGAATAATLAAVELWEGELDPGASPARFSEALRLAAGGLAAGDPSAGVRYALLTRQAQALYERSFLPSLHADEQVGQAIDALGQVVEIFAADGQHDELKPALAHLLLCLALERPRQLRAQWQRLTTESVDEFFGGLDAELYAELAGQRVARVRRIAGDLGPGAPPEARVRAANLARALRDQQVIDLGAQRGELEALIARLSAEAPDAP
jgi:hypothetical protein